MINPHSSLSVTDVVAMARFARRERAEFSRLVLHVCFLQSHVLYHNRLTKTHQRPANFLKLRPDFKVSIQFSILLNISVLHGLTHRSPDRIDHSNIWAFCRCTSKHNLQSSIHLQDPAFDSKGHYLQAHLSLCLQICRFTTLMLHAHW
jgi:hypothetical protein